jgi:hypothetical protein
MIGHNDYAIRSPRMKKVVMAASDVIHIKTCPFERLDNLARGHGR